MRLAPSAALLITLCLPVCSLAEDEYVPAAGLEAGDLTPAEVARRAERTFATHCNKRTPEEVRRNASALTAVSGEWASLAEYYERVEKKTYLMYWRGMLAYCLGRPEEAGEDLTGFAKLEGSNQGLRALTQEAARVLRKLGLKVPRADVLNEAEGEQAADSRPVLDSAAVATNANAVHGEHCASSVSVHGMNSYSPSPHNVHGTHRRSET